MGYVALFLKIDYLKQIQWLTAIKRPRHWLCFGFVPCLFLFFSIDCRLFHRQKRIVFSPILARSSIFTGVSACPHWLCSPMPFRPLVFNGLRVICCTHAGLAVSTRLAPAFLLGIFNIPSNFAPRWAKGQREGERPGDGTEMQSSQPRPMTSARCMKMPPRTDVYLCNIIP